MYSTPFSPCVGQTLGAVGLLYPFIKSYWKPSCVDSCNISQHVDFLTDEYMSCYRSMTCVYVVPTGQTKLSVSRSMLCSEAVEAGEMKSDVGNIQERLC